MFPFRTSSIFRSRWMALLWSAGIVWMAIDIADPDANADGNSAEQSDGKGATVDSALMRQAERALEKLGK